MAESYSVQKLGTENVPWCLVRMCENEKGEVYWKLIKAYKEHHLAVRAMKLMRDHKDHNYAEAVFPMLSSIEPDISIDFEWLEPALWGLWETIRGHLDVRTCQTCVQHYIATFIKTTAAYEEEITLLHEEAAGEDI